MVTVIFERFNGCVSENEICIQDLMVVCICYAIDQCNARCTGERKEKKKMKIWERKREWTLYSRFDGRASDMPLINVMPDGTGERKEKKILKNWDGKREWICIESFVKHWYLGKSVKC